MKLSRLVAATFVAAMLNLGLAGAARAGSDAAAARCLALAMYWEAKGEGRTGMLAVASVVLNRVAHPAFPNTVCAVVQQGGETPPCQFSWWCDGKSDRPVEPRPWSLAQTLARQVLAGPPTDYTEGALFYHSHQISYPWERRRTRTVQIGRHVFYR